LKYKGGNSYSGVTYNGTYTSQITIVGVEDLGGGMKADFNYESDINPTTQYNTGVATLNGTYTSTTGAAATASSGQTPSTWGNGQVKLGLGGSFGYIGFGAINNAGLDANQIGSPYGTAFGSGYGITQGAVGGGYGTSAKVRYDNSVRYLTPELGVAGLKGSFVYRAKNDKTANNMFSTSTGLQGQSGVQEVALVYMNGPLNAIIVNQKDDGLGVKDVTGAAQTAAKAYTKNDLAANYTMGATTVYGGYQTMKNDMTSGTTQVDVKTTRYAVKYAVNSQLSLSAAYASAKVNAGTYAGNKTTVSGIGADYALSKLTTLYFRSENVNDAGGLRATTQSDATTVIGAGFAGAPADQKVTRTAVGLRVLF
jgi:predicted porin